eukprot:115127_1
MNHMTKKSMAMLGLDVSKHEGYELPEDYKQGLYCPEELKTGELDSFSMRDLYKFHLGRQVEDEEKTKHKHNDDEKQKKQRERDKNKSNTDMEYCQLVFDIKHCIFKAGNDTKLLFSIFDDTEKRIVTEEYCLHLSENNFPKVGSPEDCKVLFKNIPVNILQHDVYITCKIYRIGPMEAPDVMTKKTQSKKSGKKGSSIVRPYAATVIRLKDHIADLLRNPEREFTFQPQTAPICCPKEESTFVALTFDLIAGEKQNTYYTAPLSIGIAHGLILYRGDVSVVEAKYPFYDKLTEVEPLSIDPSLHIERHMLYVTIHDIHVNQRNKRSACNVCIKMQLRDNKTYKPIPGSMMLGKGKMAVPELETTSPVYYHNNDPIINQTYHILIPSDIDRLSQCHLYFTLWHIPATNKKPDERGFAFIKLYHKKLAQLTANNEYELPLYRYDKKTQSSYLTVDQNDNQHQNVDPNGDAQSQNNATSILKSENKSIRIFFKLSSTKIYSNIDIHKFLTWKNHDIESVVAAVRRVARQPFVHLLTILDELMKCIFEIMLQSTDNNLIEQTYATLIGVLGEANKNTTVKYKPRIEEWIELHFKYSRVWRTLSIQQSRLLQWIASAEAVQAQSKEASTPLKQRSAEIIRQLQNCMRGIKYLFDIMKRSCQIEIDEARTISDKNKITNEYNRQITALFYSMNRVMGLKQPKTVAGVQSFALRNFLSLMDSVPTQTSKELTQTVVKFINSIHNQGVNNSVEKLLLIRKCLHHPKLERVDIVHILLPSICKSLSYHINQSKDERACCATIIAKCIPFLDPKRPRTTYGGQLIPNHENVIPSPQLYDEFAILMLKLFGILDEIRHNDLSQLVSVQKVFGKQIKKNKTFKSNEAITLISKDQLLVHRDLFIAIADLSRIIMNHMNEINGNGNQNSQDPCDVASWGLKCDAIDKAITTLRKENENEAVLVIESALKCCNNILQKSIFATSWTVMRMVEAEVAMRCLSWFGSTLKRNYLSKSFENGRSLWKQWLRLGMIFLSNEDFALEDISTEKAELIRDNYGDVRNIAIKKLTVSWNVLTPHRAALADTMIKAAVEASASEVQEIQEFAIDVYFEMIKSEFEKSNHIQSVETHTIDQIDQLTAKYSNKENVINRYLDFFRIRVQKKLDQIEAESSELAKMGNTFLNDIERLYGYLVKLKKLPNKAEYEDERTSATLKLLEYLRGSGKRELFNRYIHHLAIMHQTLGNHIEAAICFKEHADELGWDDTKWLQEEPLVGLPASFEWKRHVNLCELAHKHFMLGEAWEMGVAVCQELAKAYQHQIFDLKALSSILEKQSHLWKLIANQDRVFHSSYFVQFRGILNNESFVYRSGNGKNPEPIRAFTDRIKRKYVNAKVINSGAPIPDDICANATAESPFIQITTLTPSSMEELGGGAFKWNESKNKKAPLRLKKYYRENETAVYFYTNAIQKKKHKKDNEFRSLWITKTFIVCQDSIPAKRRRVPVISTKVVEFTPFQTATNNLIQKKS